MPVQRTADFGELLMIYTKNCFGGRIFPFYSDAIKASVTDEHTLCWEIPRPAEKTRGFAMTPSWWPFAFLVIIPAISLYAGGVILTAAVFQAEGRISRAYAADGHDSPLNLD